MNLRLFLSLVLLSVCCSALADEPLVHISHLNWQQIRGDAVDIHATGDNVIYALGKNHRIYRWRAGRGWLVLPGSFQQLTIDRANKPWAIDTEGALRRFNGLWWDVYPSELTPLLVAASVSDDDVFVLADNGKLLRWVAEDKEFVVTDLEVSDPFTVTDFVVDREGTLWVLHSNQTLKSGTGKGTVVARNTAAITSTAAGELLAVSSHGHLTLPGRNAQPADIPYAVRAFSLAADDTPWFVTGKGEIYTTSTLVSTAPDVKAEVQPAPDSPQDADGQAARAADLLVADNTGPQFPELKFIQIRGTAQNELEISHDGSVYAVSPDLNLQRWRNQQKTFTDFPGTARHLTVDKSGALWVVNPTGQVFRLEEKRWQKIDSVMAKNLIAAQTGEVFLLSAADSVYRYNSIHKRFQKVTGWQATDIVTDADGAVWLLTPRGQLRKCAEDNCSIQSAPLAKAIETGPEGSFFLITQRDQLYRRNQDNEWQFIRRDVSDISVGPAGYPWIIDIKDRVWYSALFGRDETEDRQYALQIQGSTLETDQIAGITVNRRMRFSQVSLPAMNGGDISLVPSATGVISMAGYGTAGADDITWVNTYCINNQGDSYCGFPETCSSALTPGCEPCNSAQNQGSSVCTEVSGSGNYQGLSSGDWINGFCLAQPQDPGCSFMGQPGSADQVNCSNPMNQTHTVCVQFGNDLSGSEQHIVSDVQRYDTASKRFRDVRIPDATVAYTYDEEGRLVVVKDDASLWRETSANSGRYRKITAPADGTQAKNITSGGDTLYLLNTEGALAVSSSGEKFVIEKDTPLLAEIQADSSGRLWALNTNRILIRDNDNYSLASGPVADGLSNLVTTVEGEVYVVINKRIARLNRTSRIPETVQGSYPDVKSLAADHQGKLWLLSDDGRLFKQI